MPNWDYFFSFLIMMASLMSYINFTGKKGPFKNGSTKLFWIDWSYGCVEGFTKMVNFSIFWHLEPDLN